MSWDLPSWGQMYAETHPDEHAAELAERSFWVKVAREKSKVGKLTPQAFFEAATTTAAALDHLERYGIPSGPLSRR
jgi:hypothetical protein